VSRSSAKATGVFQRTDEPHDRALEHPRDFGTAWQNVMNSQQVVDLGPLSLRLRLVERFARSDHFLVVLIPNDPFAFESFEYVDRDLLVHNSTPHVRQGKFHSAVILPQRTTLTNLAVQEVPM
jgi:hypothetical protein